MNRKASWYSTGNCNHYLIITSNGEGNGSPLQYSCLEKPMDRGAWRAMVHSVADSQTRLMRLSTHMHSGVCSVEIPNRCAAHLKLRETSIKEGKSS